MQVHLLQHQVYRDMAACELCEFRCANTTCREAYPCPSGKPALPLAPLHPCHTLRAWRKCSDNNPDLPTSLKGAL